MVHRNKLALMVLMALTAAGCAAEVADLEGDPDVQADRQNYVDAINGLRAVNGLRSINGLRIINGLRSVNGLRVINGLTTTNGLRVVNGLRVINGLRTMNGNPTVNGQVVTAPDGMLSRTTGMMASNDGVATAKYLVRCALHRNTTINIKDFMGATLALKGELNLAPQWETGVCDKACQEKISACMMAFTNGTGTNMNIAMSAQDTVLGASPPSGWDQEAAFYGNIFFGSDEPEKGGAFWCMGDQTYDSNSGWYQGNYVARFCQGYSNPDDCPFQQSFDACSYYWPASNACSNSLTDSSALKNCRDNTGRTWSYAVTTHVQNIDQYWW